MFDDTLMESFFYYKRYGEIIMTKINDAYKELTYDEKVQKYKCVLAIMQEFLPSMSSYYMNSYINELSSIYTKINDSKELTSIEYFPLNDKLVLNKGTLNEVTIERCCNENNNEVITVLKDSYLTLFGYDKYDDNDKKVPLVIL